MELLGSFIVETTTYKGELYMRHSSAAWYIFNPALGQFNRVSDSDVCDLEREFGYAVRRVHYDIMPDGLTNEGRRNVPR